MNIAYFGGGAFGIPTLASLAQRHQLVAVVTQPDKRAGRGRGMRTTPIADWAAEHMPDAPLVKPPDVNEQEVITRIRSFDADAWVIIAFGQKLSPALLHGIFAINLHASLLPRWRGAAPINAAILAGDTETGLSVITLADRMDAGEILAQSRRPIEPSNTAGDLHDSLAANGPVLVQSVLDACETGTLTPRIQDESLVTYAPKLSAKDRWLDFTQPAAACRLRIHGLTPWPGIGITIDAAMCKALRATAIERTHNAPPGTLVDPAQGHITCAPGTVLQLLEVQPPGKRAMPWADYARGHFFPQDAHVHTKPS